MKSYQKNLATTKNAVLINKHFFPLANKHIPLHIFVKLKAINVKLKSLFSDVNQRLCAKFGGNWPIEGAINREISSDIKVDRNPMKFGEHNAEALQRPNS